MQHRSGGACAVANGARQLSFPRLATSHERPPAADSFDERAPLRGAAEPPAAEAIHEGREAKHDRYRLLFQELCSSFNSERWDKRRASWASLVALHGAQADEAADLVRDVIIQSSDKDDPLTWFSATVLVRLKEHDWWSRKICCWFNKRKPRLKTVQSFLLILEE